MVRTAVKVKPATLKPKMPKTTTPVTPQIKNAGMKSYMQASKLV